MEKKPEEQKGLFKRIKEGIDDHEEQMVVLGAMVKNKTKRNLRHD